MSATVNALLNDLYSGRKCRIWSGRGSCVKREGHYSDTHKDELGQVFSVSDAGEVKILWLAGGAKV